jgi:hypothetical protein
MNRIAIVAAAIGVIALVTGCAGTNPHHGTAMPDPAAFNAHFGDMDTDGDGLVSPSEFNAHFDNPEAKVFDAVDLDGNGRIDHDEWHTFKQAHGLKHHE